MPTLLTLSSEKKYPIIPIRNGVVFPHTESVLIFGRPRSVAAIDSAFKQNSLAVVVMQKNPNVNEPTASDLYGIGTLVKIEKILKNNDGHGKTEINALIRGLERVQILSFDTFEPFLHGTVITVPETIQEDNEMQALVKHITNQLKRAVSLGKSMDFISFMKITGGLPVLELTNQIASVVEMKAEDRQQLLEEGNIKKRLTSLVAYLNAEIRVLEIEKNIETKTQEKFDKSFRKTVLEERLKTIEKELGKDGENREIKQYLDKIRKVKMPVEVEKKARQELRRLSQMSQYNPEASYVRSYLDWLTEIPWDFASRGNLDMKHAEKILDEDHYGLK
ncbi:LON peptidase substrate-binding domain-containing protein, partial [Candidatus Roizmanbacteria bacterium]|nr:LON peptidase substrate-binding domain-containing protein [Candidatus Roizmanbacteria bacterium]